MLFLNQIVLQNDHYEILGVDSNAQINEIKKAYRKKAHKLHPDKNRYDTTSEFQKLNDAYLAICKAKKEPYTILGDEVFGDSVFNYKEAESTSYFSDMEVIKYGTSIDTLCCGCEDYKERCLSYHKQDPRILCKHLISEFRVVELNDVILPASFLPYKEEILQSKYEGKGFPLFKDIVFFKHSIIALPKSEEKVYLYIKEHENPKLLYKRFVASKTDEGNYTWCDAKEDDGGITENVKKTELLFLDAKESLGTIFNITNNDNFLCYDSVVEYEKEVQDILTASEKGLLLSKMFVYSLPNYVYNNNEEEAYKKRNLYLNSMYETLREYDSPTELLKFHKSRFTPRSFNKKLQELGFLTKMESYNNNNWILRSKGLKWGMNYAYNSKYTHIKTPPWYKISFFDYATSSLQTEHRYGLKRMTKVLFKKDKFEELLELMNEHITPVKKPEDKVVFSEIVPQSSFISKIKKLFSI